MDCHWGLAGGLSLTDTDFGTKLLGLADGLSLRVGRWILTWACRWTLTDLHGLVHQALDGLLLTYTHQALDGLSQTYTHQALDGLSLTYTHLGTKV